MKANSISALIFRWVAVKLDQKGLVVVFSIISWQWNGRIPNRHHIGQGSSPEAWGSVCLMVLYGSQSAFN